VQLYNDILLDISCSRIGELHLWCLVQIRR